MRRERPATYARLALLVALCFFPGAGAAAGLKLPACAPYGLGVVEQPVATPGRRAQEVMLTAGWAAGIEGRHSCGVKTTVRVTITGSNRAAATARWSVNGVLDPWSAVAHTWVWRNWCGPIDHGKVRVKLSLPSGTFVLQRIPEPPACVNKDAATTVSDVGTGTKYVKRPGDPIPAHILPIGFPPPLHEELIKVTNAWIVSDGYTLVAVYAGSAGHDSSIGRLAILRINEIFGIEYEPPDLVDVGTIGALKITTAPQGAASETSAQHGQLGFTAADGSKGLLELRGDHVRILTRH